MCANMFLTDLHFAACNKLNRRLHSIRRLRRSVTVLCDFYSHFFCCSCCCFILFIISCCCSHSQTLHFKMMKERTQKHIFFSSPTKTISFILCTLARATLMRFVHPSPYIAREERCVVMMKKVQSYTRVNDIYKTFLTYLARIQHIYL